MKHKIISTDVIDGLRTLHMKFFSIRWVGEWAEVTTLFLDRHRDNIQIYIGQQGDNEYLLTDDSYTLNDLEISDCFFDTSEERAILDALITHCGVVLGGSRA